MTPVLRIRNEGGQTQFTDAGDNYVFRGHVPGASLGGYPSWGSVTASSLIAYQPIDWLYVHELHSKSVQNGAYVFTSWAEAPTPKLASAGLRIYKNGSVVYSVGEGAPLPLVVLDYLQLTPDDLGNGLVKTYDSLVRPAVIPLSYSYFIDIQSEHFTGYGPNGWTEWYVNSEDHTIPQCRVVDNEVQFKYDIKNIYWLEEQNGNPESAVGAPRFNCLIVDTTHFYQQPT